MHVGKLGIGDFVFPDDHYYSFFKFEETSHKRTVKFIDGQKNGSQRDYRIRSEWQDARKIQRI
jgi:hypothetical protein